MNVNSLLKEAKTKVDTLDAELILLDILDEQDRSFLTLNEELILSPKQILKFRECIKERKEGKPLAYILGFREFYGRQFNVSRDVLIPRPESEAIIEFTKEIFPRPKTILDVGTGSGCLGISLKLEIKDAEVFASDFSKSALKIASDNARNLGAEVKFFESDLLENVEGKFDLIVANLPYVDQNWGWTSGIEFEPESALYAEDGGLYFIKKLIRQAENRAKYLILESDTSQQNDIIEYAKKYCFSLITKDNFISVFVKK